MPIVLESFFNPSHKEQWTTHIKIKEVDIIVEVVIGSVQWKCKELNRDELDLLEEISLLLTSMNVEVGKRVKDDIS